ncbi:MAG: hypothetical protein DWP97_02290, partial [Calditrichaeota bacterium]
MKSTGKLIIFFLFIGTVCTNSFALDRNAYDELSAVIDSAIVLETPVFAPKAWQKAQEYFKKAGQAISQQKNQKNIDKEVSQAREYIENAIKSTEVGKLALSEYLDQRKRAQTAKAPTLVTELYIEAETQFKKATEKVESGDVKNGLKEAQKAMPLFSTAELEAVRKDILGKADQLI